MKRVLVVMGSASDAEALKPCARQLEQFGIPYEVRVASAHRTPETAARLAEEARADGVGVIIAAAGKAAHLAGVIAGHTTLPVIGIPMKSSTLDGLDSLLSTVQMPSGVPVATVAIDGAQNAAILAAQILSLGDAELEAKLAAFKKSLAAKTAEADAKIEL